MVGRASHKRKQVGVSGGAWHKRKKYIIRKFWRIEKIFKWLT